MPIFILGTYRSLSIIPFFPQQFVYDFPNGAGRKCLILGAFAIGLLSSGAAQAHELDLLRGGSGAVVEAGEAFDLASVDHSRLVVGFRGAGVQPAQSDSAAGLVAKLADGTDASPPLPQSAPSPTQQESGKVQGPGLPVAEQGTDERGADYLRTQRLLARMELVYQVLNVADAATTISCVERGTCREQNPLYGGPRPSWARVAGIKAGVGLLHYMVYRSLVKAEPRVAKIFEFSTIVIQGAAVLWNMTIVLK